MKLHIGCGLVHLPGFVNVDLFSNVGADMCCDITRIPYPPESCDLIYASHVLEHVHRHMVLSTLTHWRDLLKPGGVLRLAVPDFNAICSRYSQTGELSELMGLLYGGQNYTRNYHTVVFDQSSLSRALEAVGFTRIYRWFPSKTEHAEFDDYSRAYLPHKDPTGTLMSLNLEAVK